MTEPKDIQKQEPKAKLALTNRGFVPTDIEGVYRQANLIAKSDFAMQMYRNNEANCMILVEMSARMGVPWMMLMQHMYIVHERPALDATISTALVNQSGEFVDPIEYEVEGDNAKASNYRVRAYATRVSTKKMLYGPWIDWPLVKGEGWDAKTGSKWKTMPDQMFHYRAASWFQRRYCPELTMGMLTREEAEEIPRKQVDSRTFDEAQKQESEKIKSEAGSDQVDVNLDEPTATPEETAERQARVDKLKAEIKADAEEKYKKKKKSKKKKTAKDKDQLPKYHCYGCNEDFDVPILKGGGELQCPKCFSLNVKPETEIDPDIHEDNN